MRPSRNPIPALISRKPKAVSPHVSTVRELTVPNFITVSLKGTVAEAIRTVRQSAKHGIFYVYVVDSDQRLCGVVSVRALLVAKDDDPIDRIYSPGAVSLKASAPVQEAYRRFAKDRFLSLPVVDDAGVLVGVLHAHELIEEYEKGMEELFEERTRGALFELLGLKGKSEKEPVWRTAWSRFPWLLVNVFGGAISAYFIHRLGVGLRDAVLFLAFMPVLLIITESMGMQTLTVVISRLHGVGQTPRQGSTWLREMGVVALLGLLCALTISVPVFLWQRSWPLSAAIATTIGLGFVGVGLLANALPNLFHRLKVDPRLAAGPVVLALADAGTLVLYLCLGLWLQRIAS